MLASGESPPVQPQSLSIILQAAAQFLLSDNHRGATVVSGEFSKKADHSKRFGAKAKTTNKRNTMTRPKRNDEPIQLTKHDLMRMRTEDDAIKSLLQTLLQEVLKAEMDEALRAGKNERTTGRLGYRSGHYPRTLVTRVGKLELRVPQGSEKGPRLAFAVD
jgi:hypothetical protein